MPGAVPQLHRAVITAVATARYGSRTPSGRVALRRRSTSSSASRPCGRGEQDQRKPTNQPRSMTAPERRCRRGQVREAAVGDGERDQPDADQGKERDALPAAAKPGEHEQNDRDDDDVAARVGEGDRQREEAVGAARASGRTAGAS